MKADEILYSGFLMVVAKDVSGYIDERCAVIKQLLNLLDVEMGTHQPHLMRN